VKTQAEAKKAILAALERMPAEAFGYLALSMRASAMTQGGLTQVWPDGIGGFTGASREAIAAARSAADAYVEAES